MDYFCVRGKVKNLLWGQHIKMKNYYFLCILQFQLLVLTQCLGGIFTFWGPNGLLFWLE